MGLKYSKQRHKPRITKQQIPWLLRGAIRSNNVETLQYLLSYPNDVDPSMVIDGVCPLNLAIELGHLQMVKILIKAGANIHVPDAPRYPLLQAALFGRSEIAELLIKSGCDVNMQNERHETALHLLCQQTSDRYLGTARVLLHYLGNPNVLDEDGLAPLHKASAEMVPVICSVDPTDLNLYSRDGDTALTSAAKDRRESVVAALIKAAADADQLAAQSRATAAISATPSGASTPSSTSTTSTMTGCGGRSRLHRSTPTPPPLDGLHTGATSGSGSAGGSCVTVVVGVLGVQQGRRGHSANTDAPAPPPPPLPPAKRRLDLDKADRIGMTALMIAADAGHAGLTMAAMLVAAGCDIAVTDKMGMNALHYACYVGVLPMVRFLLEQAVDKTLDLLNSQDKYGRSLIYLATCRGHTEVVNYLLSRGADIHLPNKEHKSPLYISAYFGHVEIVNALLRHEAQVDQADSHNKTPLYVATYHGRSDIVDLLLQANAAVNAPDKNGKTPLYIAVLHGHLHIACKLINAGASVNRPDREGLGPLHMAVKFPKLDIPMVKLLLNNGCDPLNLANFTKWLLKHNIIPEDCINGDREFSTWLRREETNVRSLKRLCRSEIQRTLGHTDSMKTKVNKLPLPQHLQSYVSMKAL